MRKLVSICCLFLITNPSFAFKNKNPFFKQTTSEAGITLSSNGELSAISFTGIQYWGLGKDKRNFKLGLGGRLTSTFGGKELIYMTAPAELTSGKKGPGVFFADQIPKNIDTLKLASTQINSINAYLALRYDFKKRWGVEFNIDLVGFSFGGKKSSTLTYGEKSDATRITDAKPTSRNALLISDNDIGSLNSEFIVSYLCKKNLKLRAGAAFLFNEYRVENPVLYTNTLGTVVDTDRYRTKALTIGLGVNYIFKHKK